MDVHGQEWRRNAHRPANSNSKFDPEMLSWREPNQACARTAVIRKSRSGARTNMIPSAANQIRFPAASRNQGQFKSYAGAHANRQSRFEARSARRWGDWGVLGIPTPVLWFDALYEAAAIEEEDESMMPPPIPGLWP